MASRDSAVRADSPIGIHTSFWSRFRNRQGGSSDVFGRFTEILARGMGTPWFLLALAIFCILWLIYNTTAPLHLRFDSAANGFTALTLILSLQASFSSPLILLSQNRQADRDRVQFEQDRVRAARTLSDTEYLAREVVALRMAVKEIQVDTEVQDSLAEIKAVLDRLATNPPKSPSAHV